MEPLPKRDKRRGVLNLPVIHLFVDVFAPDADVFYQLGRHVDSELLLPCPPPFKHHITIGTSRHKGLGPLFLADRFGFGSPGLLWIVGPISEMPVIFFSRRIIDRIGARNFFALGLGGIAVRLLGFAAATPIAFAVGYTLFNRIPFAPLRLRMSGPTLGRLLKAQLGPRFVSANLPMLHKRTMAGSTQSEFRPGVAEVDTRIDLNGEFERQFLGDVMLFAMERLTAAGYPARRPAQADFSATLDDLRDDLLADYNARRTDIVANLDKLNEMLDDPNAWWSTVAHQSALAAFRNFADNIARNFAEDATWVARVNSPQYWQVKRAELATALERHA